jgi:nucleoside-diphosphate-sugar epimerase
MSNTVLVTGSGTPIGRYIVDALADEGENVVRYTDTQAVTRYEVGAETAVGPLSDLPRLLHVMREHGVRQIVQAADASDPRISIDTPVATVLANVGSILHLLEAARLAQIEGRIVLLSSIAVYGHNLGRIDESSPLHPRTPYAVTKVTGEQLGSIYSDLYGLDVVALRLGEQYGPEIAPPPALRAVMKAGLGIEPFRSPAGADHVFHLTHGEDVSRAVVAALRANDASQRTYNVTGGEAHSLAQIVELIRDRFPESHIDLGPGRFPGLDIQTAVDIRAADRELGFRPIWGLARGLDDYAEWLIAGREAA